MNRRKIYLTVVKIAAVVAWCGAMGLYYGITKEITAVAVVSVAVGLVGLFAVVLFASLAAVADKKTKARWRTYAGYTYDGKTDYASEIEKIRQNYAADGDPKKNRIPKPNFAGARPFCDYSVLRGGTVRYAALVEANTELFRFTPHNVHRIFPAVVVYGTDGYFDENPHELKIIAEKLYQDRENNFLKDETKYFSDIRLPQELAGDGEVFATTVMVYCYHLPFGMLAGDFSVFPIIADPNSSKSVFIVNSEYWTPPIIAEYCGLREVDPFESDGAETETETEISENN